MDANKSTDILVEYLLSVVDTQQEVLVIYSPEADPTKFVQGMVTSSLECYYNEVDEHYHIGDVCFTDAYMVWGVIQLGQCADKVYTNDDTPDHTLKVSVSIHSWDTGDMGGFSEDLVITAQD